MASEVIPYLIVKGKESRVTWLARAPIPNRFHSLIVDLSSGQSLGGRFNKQQADEALAANAGAIKIAVERLSHRRASEYLPK